jgi:uncharacterized membrane protein YccC
MNYSQGYESIVVQYYIPMILGILLLAGLAQLYILLKPTNSIIGWLFVLVGCTGFIWIEMLRGEKNSAFYALLNSRT